MAIFTEHLESPAARLRKAFAVLVHDGQIAAAAFRRDSIFRLSLQKVVDDGGAVRKTSPMASFCIGQHGHRLVIGINVVDPASVLEIGAFRAGDAASDMRPESVAFG